MDAETQFLQTLIEQGFGLDVENKLQKLSSKVSWAKGWPKNKVAFWNSEAFMWQTKIDKEQRADISAKIIELIQKNTHTSGKNLDLGAGAYSYIPSVGIDISPKMLQLNDVAFEKVCADIEQTFPFNEKSFHSITAVFILNYVQNLSKVLNECKRVLQDNGVLLIVLSNIGIHPRHKKHQINDFDKSCWQKIIEQQGFRVKVKIDDNLLFFTCNPIQM